VIVPTAVPYNPSTMGLVSWWTMNETSGTRNDSYGTNHLTDNNTVTYATGLNGNAANFVTTNQEYLSITDNASISTGDVDFTWAANVYMNNNNTSYVIIDKSDNVNQTLFDYRLAYNSGTGFRFRTSSTVYVDSGAVSANAWHTVIAWHDSVHNTINIQVDAGVVNSIAFSGGTTDTTYPLTIGAYSNGTTGLDGRIDEVAFYKRVLTAGERSWLYNGGAARTFTDINPPVANPGTTNLIAWWTMNEASGTRVDSTGATANNLTDNNTVGSVTGQRGTAASFVAANSESLSTNDNAALSLNGTNFTIAGWVKFSSLGTAQSFISKLSSGNVEYQIYKGTNDTIVFAAYANTAGTTGAAVATTNTVAANTWYFVVAQYDGTAVKISLNAGNFASVAYSSGVVDGTNAFRLGAHGSGAYTDGVLDEVAIYKRVLTQSEIYWLYNNGNGRTYTEVNPSTVQGWYSNNYSYAGTQIGNALYKQPHAVTSVNRINFTDAFAYDQNGNMTCRAESNIVYLQTYSAENRITSIAKLASGTCAAPGNYATKWDFTYDGDGTRTATLTTPYVNGQPQTPSLTRYYFGGALETSGSSVKKYYSFAGQTIAMKDSTGLKYFLTDHLGSIIGIIDSTTGTLTQQRYLPFGAPRTDVGSITQTDFGYTGQRKLDSGMGGIMDYKARFYSPYLNRFLQPDSLIPNLLSSQGWNRYSYVSNSPIRFIDPTGHTEACNIYEDDCHSGTTEANSTNNGGSGGNPDDALDKPNHHKPANPLGHHLSPDELKVLAMTMYYEYKGYKPREAINYDIVYMKFWVFLNLINTRVDQINKSTPVYNASGQMIGTWNVYVAIAGHEKPLKPAMAQWNNVGQYGWDPDSYMGQYDALLKNANSILSGTSTEKDTLAKFLKQATNAEASWYQNGSASSADPTQGSWSFVDHPVSDPVKPWWNVVSETFDFEPGVPMYTRFDDPK
jgi:RHS repeat-associated protein